MNIEGIKLCRGNAGPNIGTTGRGCFMNVISYLNGDIVPSDRPSCVHPFVQDVGIFLNDTLNTEARQKLIPFIQRAMLSRDLSSHSLLDTMHYIIRETLYEMRMPFPEYSSSFDHGSPTDAVRRLLEKGVISQYHAEYIMFQWLDRVLPKINEDYTTSLEVVNRLDKLQELAAQDIPTPRFDDMLSEYTTSLKSMDAFANTIFYSHKDAMPQYITEMTYFVIPKEHKNGQMYKELSMKELACIS